MLMCAAMEWSDGDHWCLEVDLFPGMTDFKCAVVRQDGSVVCWEPGANRTVEVLLPLHLPPALLPGPLPCIHHVMEFSWSMPLFKASIKASVQG